MAKQKGKSAEKAFREGLQMVSPGTMVRQAISSILQSETGALLCFGPPKRLADLSEGGVQLDSPTTPQLLFELSKMDGAILLNADGSRILFANRFLKPDSATFTNETGTRHRAAERMAKEAKCCVVAVSERRSSVTLFIHDRRHHLDSIATLLNKAVQTLQTMEKFMSSLNQALQELSVREFQDMVTIFDVCRTVQRYEMVRRIGMEMDPYILELGDEGRLIELQLNELLAPLEEFVLVVKDYFRDKAKGSFEATLKKLSELEQEELANPSHIAQILGYGTNLRTIDTYLSPRGYRALAQTHRLSDGIIENLVDQFSTLQQILRAPKDELVEVDGVGEVLAERVRVGLNLLHNQLSVERR